MTVINYTYNLYLNIPNGKSMLMTMDLDPYNRDNTEISLTYPEEVKGSGYGSYNRTEYRNITIPLKDVLKLLNQYGKVKVMDIV